MVTALITGMGSTTAISVAKGLRSQTEKSVRIIGTDTHQRNEIAGSHFCDEFYRVPPANDPSYIPAVLDICKRESIQVMFPVIDAELEVLSPYRNLFKEIGVYIWVSEVNTINLCNDKYQTYLFFKQKNIPTPQTWLPKEVENRKDLPFPLIVKPVKGVSSRDVFRVDNTCELTQALGKVTEPIIQEYIMGEEFTIDVLADENSRILSIVPRERIEVRAGISYKGRTVRDENLICQSGAIAQALLVKGACNIQCRLRDGEPVFLEVNPRFSGALPLTIAAGVNIPLLLLKLALGETLDQVYYDFKEGVYMARYFEEVFCVIDQ